MTLRVKSATEYRIPIERQSPKTGEWESTGCLVFDVADTKLSKRLFDMYDKITALTSQYETKAAEIDAQADEPYRTIESGGEQIVITKNQHDNAELLDKFYIDARDVVDGFLGEDACQNIFGDKNYLDMFDDLTEQLRPHFQKMGLDAKGLKEKAIKKHMPNREQRRVLK